MAFLFFFSFKMKRKADDKDKKKEKKQKQTWQFQGTNKPCNLLSEDQIQIQSLNNEKIELIPIETFEELKLPKEIRKNIKFEKPTIIQSVTWSCLFNEKDLVGIAKTGSGSKMIYVGKTMAFGLPCLLHIRNKKLERDTGKPIGLVLAPTRELAVQIKEQFDLFSKVNSVCIYGYYQVNQGCTKKRAKRIIEKGNGSNSSYTRSLN
jgi:superfamily II DNA/RNA helicase